MSVTEYKEPWFVRHYGTSLILSVSAGFFIAYCIATFTGWDESTTLARWIYVNQVKHVQRILHELW